MSDIPIPLLLPSVWTNALWHDYYVPWGSTQLAAGYTSLYKEFDPTQGGDSSLLLHDANGDLVRVLQDGGNPNMTVYDWGQNATRAIFLKFVERAIGGGITSFFLDKASVSANGKSEICNHICAQLGG